MEEQRNQEQPEPKESPEEYSFLQEVIKDEAGSPKRLKAKIFRMIGLGFVFGIVACFSFCLFQPWISSKVSGDPEEVTIPKDEEEKPQEEEPGMAGEEPSKKEEFSAVMESLDTAARTARKSVVEITCSEAGGTVEKPVKEERISGVIVADNGQELLILSQVSAGADQDNIQAVFADGTAYSAVVKMEDRNLGLAVYAVNRSEFADKTWSALTVAALGSSYTVEAGDVGILVGKPFGQEDAVSYGRIAACGEKAKKADGEYEFLAVEAAGFSGGSGVVINTSGQIIGVIAQNAANKEDADVIYCYGISDIKSVIEFLSNGSAVPYVGILGMDVTESMTADRGIPEGVYVEEIEADSPAMAAGIQSGDVITSVNKEPVSSLQVYHNCMMDQEEGDKLELKGSRKGTGGEYVDIDFTVTIGAKK